MGHMGHRPPTPAMSEKLPMNSVESFPGWLQCSVGQGWGGHCNSSVSEIHIPCHWGHREKVEIKGGRVKRPLRQDLRLLVDLINAKPTL